MSSVVILAEPAQGADNRVGRRVELEDVTFRLGSAKGNELVASDEAVAEVHARIVPSANGSLAIEDDTAGDPGVFVNDAKICARTRLSDGDEIRIGTTLLHFIDGGADLDARYHDVIHWLVSHDPVTKAARTRALAERVEELKASGRSYFFVRFDLPEGDATFDALRAIAGALAGIAEPQEVVARSGARSVAVMIPDATVEGAQERARTFADAIHARSVEVSPIVTTELV